MDDDIRRPADRDVNMRTISLLLISLPVWASQSVRTDGFLYAAFSPSGYAAGSQPMRWEGRLHNFGANLPIGDYGFLHLGALGLGENPSTNSLDVGANGSGGADTLAGDVGLVCCSGATGANGDVVFRMQRDTAGTNCGGSACYTFEICNTLGGSCLFTTIPITKIATSWTGGAIYWLRQGVDAAFLRWFPGVVTAGLNGSALVTPIPIAAPSNPSFLIADWEFDGNLNDASGKTGAWQVYSGSVYYDPSPVYPPACMPGAQQSVRAGSSITLDASASYPLDGGIALTPLWRQVAGVSSGAVQWTSNQKITRPTAILPQFGSYNFQLTVTDGSGQSSSCIVHDGAAPTDSSGVVLYPPGALYSAANQFLGPLIQWGKNPWPWYDTVHKAAADANFTSLGPPAGNGIVVAMLNASVGGSDMVLPVADASWNNGNTGAAIAVGSEQILLGANVDSTHIAIWQRGYRGTTAAGAAAGAAVNQFFYWDWYDWFEGPGSGNCTVTSGSATLTCTGAHFMTGGNYAVCDSGGNPLGTSFPVVWHPADSGRTGRQVVGVASCTSDTQLTMNNVWSYLLPAGGSLHYSIGTNFELYWDDVQGDPRTIDYYDNVVGYYLLWLRSGIDTYLIAARQLADTFYFGPDCDQGYSGQINMGNVASYPSRSQSNLGLWLRSKDSPQVDMTGGLHRIVLASMWYATVYGTAVGDARERGYQVAEMAYTAALDTDSAKYDLSASVRGQTNATYAQAAAAGLAGLVSPTGLWNYYYTSQDSSGDWPGLNVAGAVTSVYDSSTVALTNGSASVAGSGSTWNCSSIMAVPGRAIWFWHNSPGSFPPNNAAGDSTYYSVTGCADATHMTISPAYAGVTCASCGYEISMDDGYVGWGNDGYAMGIATRTMHYAADALALSGDSTDSSYARTLALNSSNWVLTHAYRPDTHGVNYGVDYVNCPVPIPQSNLQCSKAGSVTQSLGFSAEGPLGWFSTYRYNQDAATKAAADAMYNQMWAKPGTCPQGSSVCSDSITAGGNYLTQWDSSVDGSWLTTNPPQPKWFGQFFGFGDYSSWPAIRLGGAAPSAPRQVYIVFSLGSVASAAKVVVAVTGPDGTATSTTCSTSPCAVTVPRLDQPAYSIRLQYQSAGGAALVSSNLPAIESQ